MTQAELIVALGDYRVVGEALAKEAGEPEKAQKWGQRVLKWKQADSIPARHRVSMLRMAVRAGVPLSPELSKLAEDVQEVLAVSAA